MMTFQNSHYSNSILSTRRRGYNPNYSRDRNYDYDYYDDGYDDYYDDYYDHRDSYYDDYDYDRGYDRRGHPREGSYRAQQPPPKRRGSSKGSAALSILLRLIFLFFIVVVLLMPQVIPDQEPFSQFKPVSDKFFEYITAGMYKYQEIPNTVEFTVERVFTIDSTGELDYKLYMPIPPNLNIDGQNAQELVSTEFSPQYTTLIHGEDNKWVWQGEMETRDTDTIQIIYHFKTAKIKWDISIDKSGVINDIPQRFTAKYLGNQWPVKDFNDNENDDTDYDGVPDTEDVDDDGDNVIDKYRIEPGNQQIKNLLLQILNDADLYTGNTLRDVGNLNVYKVVKAIYDHLDETCVYPTPEEQYLDAQDYGNYPKWATGTYDDRRGDCDDQSILFISLCRAAGIPAMLEIGALYDPTFDRWEGHGWANVVIPYNDWYAEEKGENTITPMIDQVNDIFLFRDPNRFSEWVDDGVRGSIDPNTGEWNPSNLEKRYLAWEYQRGDQSVNVEFDEEYITLDFTANPPEKQLYL